MKRTLRGAFALLFVTGCQSVVASDSADELSAQLPQLGDLDQSGAVDAADVTKLREALAGATALGKTSFGGIGDLDQDGRVTFVDLEILQKFVGGRIKRVPVKFGDVNQDGNVTASDAALTLRAAVGTRTLTADAQLAADVNQDGAVTASDASAILRAATGQGATFPVISSCEQSRALLDTIDDLLDKVARADAAQVQPFFSTDATAFGEPAALAISGVAFRLQPFSQVRHTVIDQGSAGCVDLISYATVGSARGANRIKAHFGSNGWQIETLDSIPTQGADAQRLARPRVQWLNPLRNFHLGSPLEMTLLADHERAARLSAVTATLVTPLAQYPVSVALPKTALAAGEAVTVTLRSQACESRETCPEFPDLDLLHRAQALLRLSVTINDQTSLVQLPVNVYNGKDHQAVHISLANAEDQGLLPTEAWEEYRVRFRLRRLAHTYFAMASFNGGYSGVSARPQKVAAPWIQRLSIWNSKTAGVLNQFIEVNTAQGFSTHIEPPSDKPDNDYTRIHNPNFGFTPENEYTWQLTVQPRVVDGKDWTHFSAAFTEHRPGEDVRTSIGTIARPEKMPLRRVNSFMEAVGQTEGYLRREIEIISVQVRKAGSSELAPIDPYWFSTDADELTEGKFPGASWSSGGKLIVSSGGQAPTQPGISLLE